MAPQATYQKNDKVLCFHQELLYEAKILDVKEEDEDDNEAKETLYLVHYRGWKNTWDDWVPQDRLRAFNSENQELARNLKKEMEQARNQSKAALKVPTTATKKKGDSSARGSEERGLGANSKKRGRDAETEREEAFYAKPAIRLVFPDTLKSILVDDWENVTKNMSVARVPARYSVNTILDHFRAAEIAKRTRFAVSMEILDEIIAGLREYFNRSLGRILLYRFERPQYDQIFRRTKTTNDELEGRSMADIYGCEHLLRLLVSLPELIAQTNMDQQSASRLREELAGLTTWLARSENVEKYMGDEYISTDQEYKDKSDVGN